jgi:predicted  nucleic acid-binding Zn-ribbon protein
MSGEPDNLTLQLLREMRAAMDRQFSELRSELSDMRDRLETNETKLDGVTHVIVAGFGSLVHEIDEIKKRLDRIERERV